MGQLMLFYNFLLFNCYFYYPRNLFSDRWPESTYFPATAYPAKTCFLATEKFNFELYILFGVKLQNSY